MLKDSFKRSLSERARKMLQKADGSLNEAGYIGASAVLSAVVMASALSITTALNSYSYTDYAEVASLEVTPKEEVVNIRDALVEAWKTLDLKPVPEATEGEAQQVATTPVEKETPAEPEVVYPLQDEIAIKVESGDTLAEILQRQHIGIDDTHAIIQAMKKHFKPRNIRVGQEIQLSVERQSEQVAKLKKLEIKTSKLTRVEVEPKGEKFASAKVEVPTNRQLARAGSTVTSSFYEAGDDAGLPAPIIVELMKAYSYDVDFQRDIKPGQKLEVLFEQLVSEESGEVVGHGDLKYAAFKLGNKNFEIYRYTDRKGSSGYYKPNGESVRKALLKTPVNARISSRFGMRKHPILGYSKMHTGIDFAARTGTPIYAAGDGVINYAGRKGGYGKYIRIKHNGTYQTAYAHMSRFAKGMRNGKRVKQGQVIGYVGSTGRSTGPHLHYEILKHGKHINPNGAKFRTGRVLKGTELASFKKEQQQLKNQLASLPRLREQVAQATGAKEE